MIPHFDIPFRLEGASFAEVEQGSMSDVANCVEVCVVTPVGFRKELPTFGTSDYTFRTQPIDVQELIEQVILHEPRATMLTEQQLSELMESITLKVTPAND